MKTVDLAIGLPDNPNKSVRLLEVNGLVEKVLLDKDGEHPYTYMAQVVSVMSGEVFGVTLDVRENYSKTGDIIIPKVILDMSLADMNTLLLEVHRKCWDSQIERQEIVCKFCNKQLLMGVDLDKITMPEHYQERIDSGVDFWVTDFKIEGFDFSLEAMKSDKGLGNPTFWNDYTDAQGRYSFMQMTLPTVADALAYEKDAQNELLFWRKIGLKCIKKIYTEDGREFPAQLKSMLGIKLYDFFGGKDLKLIRRMLRDEAPILPFSYKDVCPCPSKKMIPYYVEAGSFFAS